MSELELGHFDYLNQMIKLTGITLSGSHCIAPLIEHFADKNSF
jgi:hypothetical protein